MTDEQLKLLKASVDKVVEVETIDGDRHLAQILFVFDEGETPDVFYLKGSVGGGGSFVTDGGVGCSVLLSDIAGVYPHPG
ncbi:MAG TPA: hypothetical protein VNU92_05320 [Edaphobacter sp.]|jgi:hypothetical protein|nr:hypothetical protein [Edaphobacter sp.]